MRPSESGRVASLSQVPLRKHGAARNFFRNFSSLEEENAVSVEENRDLLKLAKMKRLMDSPKITAEIKKQLLKSLLLSNPCIMESGKILI